MLTDNDDFVVSFDDLSDVLPTILGFLSLKDIMSKRRLNKKSREAVRRTIVPLTDFRVESVEEYNAMNVMTTELPNLQQISLRGPGYLHKYSDGEDPEEGRADALAQWTPHDVEIISNFSKLKILDIYCSVLNGRYAFLFNSFPLLQKLRIQWCDYLKWDLEMLAGFPLLKELDCAHNCSLTGNISSLRVLKDTFEKVTIYGCENVEGNFMDLADFPQLKELDLEETAVTGDIRDIGESDFSSVTSLVLSKTVFCGKGYELQSISDAPDLVRTVYLLKKQRPELEYYWSGFLSYGCPDWYESVDEDEDETPPFEIHFVKAGSRIGYRWATWDGDPCEVNWLDPEPDRESNGYAKYIEELEEINSKVNMYKGFHQPPTEEEYNRLCVEYQ